MAVSEAFVFVSVASLLFALPALNYHSKRSSLADIDMPLTDSSAAFITNVFMDNVDFVHEKGEPVNRGYRRAYGDI